MKKLLLSRSNFSFECQEFWKAGWRRLPVTLVSANRVRKSIDLWKLSLMSSHLMNLKNSFEIPDSLSYLLDIDIILPDFSENVVRILCDVLEGGNPDVVTNIASFNELNELIGVLNITLGPSLMKINNNNEEYCEVKFEGNNNNEEYCEVKFEGFRKDEFLKAEDKFIKEEPLNVKEELNGYIEKTPWKLTDENANILNTSINTPLIKDLSSSVGASAKSTSSNKASGSTSEKNEESVSGKLLEDALCRMTEMEQDANRLRTENEMLAKKSIEKQEIAKTAGLEKKQLEEKLSSQTKELESIKQQLSLSQQEGKKNATDLQEKAKELKRVTQQSVGLKNIQVNLQRQVNEIKKKTEDLVKKKQDANVLLTQDSHAGNENMNNVLQKMEEVQKLLVLKDAEIETQKKDIASKESEINKNKATVMQLKKISRNFRDKAEASEKILTELTLEKKKVDEELAKAIEKREAEGSTSKKDKEFGKLGELEDALCRLTAMEEDANKLRAENEELAKKSTEKEERLKAVVKNARARITKCEEEKKQLEKELEEIASKRDSAVSSEAHLQTKVSNLISQYNTLSTDKERLDGEKAKALQEKERLIEKVEQLQQELVASKMCSPAGLSPSAPTMASVPPTLKRPREAPDFDSQSGTDERTGYSGYQKKAKGKAAF